MALSGTLSTAYSGWTYRIDWSAAQSVADNNSVITCTHKLVCKSGFDLYIGTRSNSCTVGGVKQTFTSPSISTAGNTTITLGTTKHTIAHNTDGTKAVTVSSTFNIQATLSGTYKASISVSGSITLDTIPRASQPSCITWPEHTQNVGEFGDTISIHMNRNADVFTHTVRYHFGVIAGTIATGVTTGTTWTIPLGLIHQLPGTTKGSGTIFVDTYNGSTLIGTKTCGFTATVPSSVKPTCSLTLEDTSGWDKTYGSPVQSLSRINIKINATEAYQSPITAYAISAEGAKYNKAEATTGILQVAGARKISATVTDKRGRKGTTSYTMNVQAYNKPSITKLAVNRCNENGVENDQGEYIRARFSATVTALNNKNTATYTLRYKKSTEAGYDYESISALDNTYATTDYTHIFKADNNSSYDVVLEVKDSHNTTTRTTSASTAFTLMNWGANGTSVAFGKVAEKANSFECALRMYDQYGTHVSNGMSLYGGADSHIDANTTMEHLVLTALNTPSSSLWYVETIFYSTKLQTSDRRQIAMPYRRSEPAYSRYYTSGAWSAWESDALAAWPVGSIYLAYNHTDPSTLFGGKWTRITNAFLWATTSAGTIGQTGGEQTVTLTEEQMPKHNHGGTYTNAGTSRTHAWLSSNGSAMGYDSVEIGGGKAHNNMPPYIQVSVWRRTA